MKPRKQFKQKFYRALLSLESEAEAAAYCRDLLTESEIEEFACRQEVAALLNSGKTQRAVSAETGVSIATVTRVNQWLVRGENGYKTVLDKLSKSEIKSESKSNQTEVAHHTPH